MTPAELSTLKAEIQTDPKGLGYASLLPNSPGWVVDLLNAKTQSMIQPITCQTAMGWAATGPQAAIVDASNNPSHACRASCLTILSLFNAGFDIHLEDPNIKTMFDAWVTSNLITQAQQDALMALANQPASRAQVLGLPYIVEADVHQALGV